MRALADRGALVRAVVRRRAPWLLADETHVVDLALSDLSAVCRDCDVLVHLAGPNEVRAKEEPDAALTETIVGTRRIAHAAADAGIRRIVYLSTMHVYGASLVPGAVVTEDVVPAPRAIYAIARLGAEHLCAAAITDVVVIRLTNSVGAPAHPSVDRWTLVANDLCRQAVVNRELRLLSDGTQWRDFVSLDDVSRMLADIACDGIPPGTYNLGSGVPMTVRGLAETIQSVTERLTGCRPPLIAPEPVAAPAEPYRISIDKLAATGHQPSPNTQDAVEETLRFCIDHESELRP